MVRHPKCSLLLVLSAALVGSCSGGDDDDRDVTGADTALDVDDSGGGEGDVGDDADETDVSNLGDTLPDDTDADDTDDADDVDTTLPPLVCDPETALGMAGCVDEERIRQDLTFIAAPRPVGSAHWQAVQDFCADRLEALGFEVERHGYGGGVNVIGVRDGTSRAGEWVVLGAHYDHIATLDDRGELCEGADDNASGVAAMLEAARVLVERDFERTLVVACWDEEERGLVGSSAWAERAAREQLRVVVNFTFEMVGYADDAPNSQQLPEGFSVFFPDAVRELNERENRGDFIAAIGSESANAVLERLREVSERTGTPVIPLMVPEEFLQAATIGDLRRSDHAPFWDAGYPALMLTDTANFRNPFYHCAAGPDSVETIDFEFAAGVTAAATAVIAEVLDEAGAAPVGLAPECSIEDQDCGDGEVCAFTETTGSTWQTHCRPSRGETAVYEVCERPTGDAGDDTCEPGGYCSYFGVPQDIEGPTIRECRHICDPETDCGEGLACRRIGGSPSFGLCLAPCDPRETDSCEDHLGCSALYSMTSPGVSFTCELIFGGQSLGAACSDHDDCLPGLGCARGAATCQPWCGPSHPCAGDATCTPLEQPTSVDDLGICTP